MYTEIHFSHSLKNHEPYLLADIKLSDLVCVSFAFSFTGSRILGSIVTLELLILLTLLTLLNVKALQSDGATAGFWV